MKAEDTLVTNLLEGAKQFIVPIFQRDYGWGTKAFRQLGLHKVQLVLDLDDLLALAHRLLAEAHVLGDRKSVV